MSRKRAISTLIMVRIQVQDGSYYHLFYVSKILSLLLIRLSLLHEFLSDAHWEKSLILFERLLNGSLDAIPRLLVRVQ